LLADFWSIVYGLLRGDLIMRFSTTEEWDEAGGVLEMMILTLMSTRPTDQNKKDLKTALESLQQAKDALERLGFFSEEFDSSIYHY
jgi:hypothetical protein